MTQNLFRYIEGGRISGGPQALPTNWRDKGDISQWPADKLAAEGWLPNVVVDQRKLGEIDAGWFDVVSKDHVTQTLLSQPAPPADPEVQRQQALDTAVDTDPALALLRKMTPAEIDTWFSSNVTTNAQAITFLRRLTKALVRRGVL